VKISAEIFCGDPIIEPNMAIRLSERNAVLVGDQRHVKIAFSIHSRLAAVVHPQQPFFLSRNTDICWRCAPESGYNLSDQKLLPCADFMPEGIPMIAISCSACQKKLSVPEDAVGKKVKCPGCGAVTAAPAQAVASANFGTEELRAMPPAPNPDLPSAPSQLADASDRPTNPSSSKPDATQSVGPDAGYDTSLTDFLAPPQADDELGRLSKYRILKILGHGGMGVIFLGEDPKLGRKVAIKAMLPHLAQSKSSLQRFLREARAAAALEHDHIVAIHHVDEDRGVPYIVMPFLKGQPLDERLKRDEPMPLDDILRIGREVARGLDAAHKEGLIHRDIKPANIWLEAPEDRVKILDFGLARATASQEAGLTQQGAIVGTPAYMAPEQGRGESVDQRCDLFSLGVVLYRMCTSQVPFRGNDTVSTLMAVATHEPPAPSKINAQVPQELSDLVMKLLEKNADKRFSSAAEVVKAVQAIEKELARKKAATEATIGQSFVPPPSAAGETGSESAPRRRSKLPRLIAALLLLGLVVGGAWGLIVFYWQTANGTVRIEINDPDIKVAFDKNGPTISGVDKQDIKLTPGEFGLRVERGDLKFDTDKFILKRGETITLKIEWFKDGKLQVVQGDKVIGKAAMAKATPAATSKGPADPERKAVDLLKLIDPDRDAVAGKWSFLESTLATTSGPFNRLVIPYAPPAEYQIEMKLERKSSGKGLNIGFPVGGNQAMLVMDGFSSPPTSGLELLDGKLANSNDTAHKGQLLPLNRPTTVFLQVRKNEITFDCDGKVIFHWKGDPARLALYKWWAVPQTDKIFLGSQAVFHVHKMTLTPLGPMDKAVVKEGPTKETPPLTSKGPADPERKAAESLIPFAVLNLQLKSGRAIRIRAGEKLPSEPFKVAQIGFNNINKGLPATFVGATLLPAIAELRSLTAIWNHVDYVETVTGEELARLSKMPAAKTIKILVLRFQLTSSAVDSLGRFSNLESLSCMAEQTDSDTLGRLRGLPKLKGLGLVSLGKAGPLTDEAIDDLCTLELTTIGIYRSRIVDARLAGKLANMPRVEHIDLPGSQVDDEIIAVLAQGTAKLITLDISGNPVTDAGLAHLKTKTTLRVLRVGFTKVTEAGARKLSDALPKCKIELGGGKVIGPKDKTAPPPVDPDDPTPEAEGPTKATPPATSEGPTDPDRKAAESLIPFADLRLRMKAQPKEKIMELEGTIHNGVVVVESDSPLPEGAKVTVVVPAKSTLGERLKKFKGVAQDLPADLAENHDHYLHGTPKR
jgi:serine/threonine protein kinase